MKIQKWLGYGLVVLLALTAVTACQAPLDSGPAAVEAASVNSTDNASTNPPATAALVAWKPSGDPEMAAFVDLRIADSSENLQLSLLGESGESVWFSMADLPFRAALKAGDTLRIWEAGWLGTPGREGGDQNLADNTPGIWDWKTASARLMDQNGGVLRLSANGQPVDQMAWSDSSLSSPEWLTSVASTGVLVDSATALLAGGFYQLKARQQQARNAADWLAVKPAHLTLGNISCLPLAATSGEASLLAIQIPVNSAELTAPPTITVDASLLGLGSALSASPAPGDQNLWVVNLNLDNAREPGTYRLPVQAVATGITAYGNTVQASGFVTVTINPPPPSLGSVKSSLQVAAPIAGDTVILQASVEANNGARVSAVTASLVGSPLQLTLVSTTSVDGSVCWQAEFTMPADTPPGPHHWELKASDSEHQLETSGGLDFMVHRPGQAFANADLELDPSLTSAGLKPLGTGYQASTGRDGSRALHVSGTAVGNEFIFQTATPVTSPGTATTLTFWVKGTLNGKGISAQFGPAGSSTPGDIFSCGVIGSSNKSITAGSGHSYGGSIDTAGSWVKISLNLVRNHNDTSDTNLADTFGLKIGSGGLADLWLDDFCWE